MKVKVRDLKPNPYRKIDTYPIRRERVESLKESMEQTSFWDNILARTTGNGNYEIAYGHHRLVALKELGIEEVDIPVKDIDEATMLRIMANENMNDWETLPAVIDETVITAKDFIDENVKKYSYKTAPSEWRSLFESQAAYTKASRFGVGQSVIISFLGDLWKKKPAAVERALRVYQADQEGILDREAAELFEKQAHTDAFVTEVKQREIPKEKQKEIAKEIIEENTDEGGEIDMRSFDVHYHFIKEDKGTLFEDHSRPDIDDVIDELIENLHNVNSNIHFAFEHREWITPSKLAKVNALILRLFEIIKENKPEEEEHNLIGEGR